jgi:hypothetical protein
MRQRIFQVSSYLAGSISALLWSTARGFMSFFQMNANLQDFDRRSQMGSSFSRRRSVKFHPSVKSFTLQ